MNNMRLLNDVPIGYTSVLLLVVLAAFKPIISSQECPTECHCHRDALGRRALVCQTIPQDGHGQNLGGFQNLTVNGNATELEFSSLTNLVDLENLFMDKVGLTFIKREPETPWLEFMTILSLNNNRLLRLPLDTFACCSNLKELRLANNFIKEIHRDVFVILHFLETLDLANNNLQILDFNLMTSLVSLDLTNNQITDISSNGIGLNLPNLRDVRLCGNQLERTSQLERIDVRRLSALCIGDAINTFDAELFAKMPELVELELVGKGTLNENIINTLTQLRHLRVLKLSFFNIEKLTSNTFTRFDELFELHLNDIKTNQTNFDEDIFIPLRKLRVLDLKGSVELAMEFLENQKLPSSLQVVSLQEIKLSTLNKFDKLPRSLRHLSELDLSQNPLRCDNNDEQLRDLLDVIFSGSISLTNSNQTLCSEPKELRGKRLLDDLVIENIKDLRHLQPLNTSELANDKKNKSMQTNANQIQRLLQEYGVSTEYLFYFAAIMSLLTIIFLVVIIVLSVCLAKRSESSKRRNRDELEGFVRADNEYTFDNFTLTETLAECRRPNLYSSSPKQEDRRKISFRTN